MVLNTNTPVVIADDHPLYLKALATILKGIPQLGRIHQAANGMQALEMAGQHKPGLVILDLNMPLLNGLQTAERLKCEHPGSKVIILSMRQDLPTVKQAMVLGVLGYLPKEAEIEEIEEAVKSVLEGEMYFPPKLAQRLALDQLKKPKTNVFSDREWRVLHYIGKQFSDEQIASEMSESKETIEKLRSVVLYKTGCPNTNAAQLNSERNGVVT